MTMIEKVAQAIEKADQRSPIESGDSGYWYLARAAIGAMREPTEKMLFTGGHQKLFAPHLEKVVWQAMIDTALKEETK